METNQNSCCAGGVCKEDTTCGPCCKMCESMGMCKGGKGHKIMKIAVLIIVLLFVARLIGGGHGDWGDNKVINTITVSGTGEKMIKPDIATVSFGVTAENLDVSKAQTESATKINKIVEFLKTKGIEEKDIKTTNYNIYPRYNYVGATAYYPYTGKQVLAAYVISQNIEVKIRNIADAGAVLTGVGEFGVTDVSGLTFTVDNQDEVKAQARDLAIADAKAQAKVLAKGLGVKLVKITSFSENGNYPMYYAKDMMSVSSASGGAVSPQIPAGENKITSTVSVTYEIR